MKQDLDEVRLWLINQIAETLVDLSDDGEGEPDEIDELLDQMKNVANLILESINLEVTGSDGTIATATFGEG